MPVSQGHPFPPPLLPPLVRTVLRGSGSVLCGPDAVTVTVKEQETVLCCPSRPPGLPAWFPPSSVATGAWKPLPEPLTPSHTLTHEQAQVPTKSGCWRLRAEQK